MSGVDLGVAASPGLSRRARGEQQTHGEEERERERGQRRERKATWRVSEGKSDGQAVPGRMGGWAIAGGGGVEGRGWGE